jgi:rare lipoprotein A
MKNTIILFLTLFSLAGPAQEMSMGTIDYISDPSPEENKAKVYFGTASFYHEKFNGRKTANGEVYDSKKFTAACNVLPMGTWIRVTNLRNKKSVIVKTNDRLHKKMQRIVDLSYTAARELGYTGRGLTQVKVEVLGKKKPA